MTGDRLRIGVLALQGAFREHCDMLAALGAEPVEVRLPTHLEGLDGLILPGGESTTMMKLAHAYGLDVMLRHFDRPIFGTCAGMILVDREHLGLADLIVDRNAYGRQVASFEAPLNVVAEESPVPGVFIRAPRVRELGDGVEVLAEHDGDPVFLRDGDVLMASFHPELTGDTRVHRLFLRMVAAVRERVPLVAAP